MNSMVYAGRVRHHRSYPVEHTLEYPVYFFAFDLDELDTLDKTIRLFSHNRVNVVSIHDRDYLTGSGDIKQKFLSFLQPRGLPDISRIMLVTAARYFNYVFNPVSFYYCYDRDNALQCIAAEVNNTFQEKHLYILDRPKKKTDTKIIFEQPKEFHVSPFNDMAGYYLMSFSELGERVSIHITLRREDKTILNAHLAGEGRPLRADTLARTLRRFPLAAAKTVMRIYKEAFKLFFIKKLIYHPKPNPSSPMTIAGQKPTRQQRIYLSLFLKMMNKAKDGYFCVSLPDRTRLEFGDKNHRLQGRMTVRNWNAFARFLKNGEIGFGQSYVDDEWDSDDMSGLLDCYLNNIATLTPDKGVSFQFLNVLRKILFHRRRNTREGAKKNIEAHYDLGNALFQSFLDESLMYSCAIFRSPQESLEAAQLNKIHALIAKTGVRQGDRVLEIGSGWGGFAVEAAKNTGCSVTTVTLSREQHAYVQKLIRDKGLAGRVSVQLQDYRDLAGQFDKIISIEMLEAVGPEYYGSFFRQCEKLLAPKGTIGLQVITMPDHRFDQYRHSVDWIQTYIFPGGCLPSLHVLHKAMKDNSTFHVEHLENIGYHYARTLRIWRERFLKNIETIAPLGYDRTFQRMWLYYLHICEASFKNRIVNDLQIVLSRENNDTLSS